MQRYKQSVTRLSKYITVLWYFAVAQLAKEAVAMEDELYRSKLAWLGRILMCTFAPLLRMWDVATAARVDYFVAISAHFTFHRTLNRALGEVYDLVRRRRSVAGIALATTIVMTGPVSAEPRDVIDLGTYRKTFSEDFDDLDVSAWGENGSRWIAHTPYNGDFGDAAFANPEPNFPFTTKDGILRIEARKDAAGKWHSGLLASVNKKFKGFAQKNGYFEVRMKLPPGDGVWPAFWLLGVDHSAHTAEIDAIEYYGNQPGRFYSNIHVWPGKNGGEAKHIGKQTAVPTGLLTEVFCTYGVDLDERHVTFYLNRKEVWQIDRPPEFDMPFYVLVNLALGGGWPIDKAPNPSYLYVDYVHVYTRD